VARMVANVSFGWKADSSAAINYAMEMDRRRLPITLVAIVGLILASASFLYLGLFFLGGWAGGGVILQLGILVGLLTAMVLNIWVLQNRASLSSRMTALSAVATTTIVLFWLWPFF
jgi:hypothetical protein